MTTLVIPAAGQSKRYGLERPKFLLQHPNKGTMISAVIDGLGNLKDLGIDSIRIISLSCFFEEISAEKLKNEIIEKFNLPVEIDLLDNPTSSMVETLVISLSKIKTDCAIIIKDCDSLVSLNKENFLNSNFIIYADLSKFPNVVAANKSFLSLGSKNELVGIVEKNIISSLINVGCIKINSISDFISCAMEIKQSKEIYVSDVIRVMIDKQYLFQGIETNTYEDWGTLEDWKKYTNSFATIFIDLDGVLVINENPLGKKTDWSSFRPIEKNIEYLLKISKDNKKQIIFTTARSLKYKEIIEKHLNSLGFFNFNLIMELNHSKRYLVNDFAKSNQYPTAIAINLNRNSENLSDYFQFE